MSFKLCNKKEIYNSLHGCITNQKDVFTRFRYKNALMYLSCNNKFNQKALNLEIMKLDKRYDCLLF